MEIEKSEVIRMCDESKELGRKETLKAVGEFLLTKFRKGGNHTVEE